MAIADDFSIAVNGDIRYEGSGTNYTALEFHRYIGALSDDAEATGDDLHDITSTTASVRSTDQIFDLNSPYNIDDTVAEHLYDGSYGQDGGNDVYSALRVVGVVESGTEVLVVQDGKVLASYWGTGINPDAPNLIISKMMIKTRSGGADIDGKRIRVLARELGDQFKEFPVTLGLGIAVAAISTGEDLNNPSSDSTIDAFTDIAKVEGYQQIDIDGDTTDEDYYHSFDRGSYSKNQTYEWSKWLQQRSHAADTGADTGTDYTIDNATIVAQAQEFTARAQDEKLTEMRFRCKIDTGTPTGELHAELMLSDDVGAGGARPTGSILATSEPVLCSRLTSSYQEFIFRFNDNVTLTAGEKYFAIIRHPDGSASHYAAVDGNAVGVNDGNRATENPASTWTAFSAADLWFEVYSSPIIHGIAGEIFRGIDYEIDYTDEASGPFTEDEILYWGTQITYDGGGGPFTVGEYVTFTDFGTSDIINGGKVLADTGTIVTVALENITGNLSDNDVIDGLTSGETASIATTITDGDKAGGEGILLALDDNGSTGTFWIQLVHGAAPVEDLPIKGRSSSATSLADAGITSRTISPEYLGQSTGTDLIGAYGIGFDTDDVGDTDKFFDLTNTLRQPQNVVTITITGLVSGEDRVLVGPGSGSSTLEKGQWLLATALTGGGETAIVIKTGAEASPIAADTPQDGTGGNTRLRVELDSGIYRRQAYISYTGSTFTIASSDYSGGNSAAIDNDVFVAYIDVLADAGTESFSAVYTSGRDVFIRVRDGGATPIKTHEAEVTFPTTDQSYAAVRNTDT
jgi:hypothetical protein